MLKGFKDFILRGNVIDLAVAVVIGAAFTAIVTALVEGIFNPVIALLFNADSIAGAGITIREASEGSEAIVLSWGRVLSALIQFLLIAAVVYFALIVPMNYLKSKAFKKRENDEAPAPAVPSETDLLVEIRDLLAAQNAGQRGVESHPAFNSGAQQQQQQQPEK
ncbi:large conductance mechanosensitive channel protein MscL [Homoserinibacter sp. YIM 151385]|uniref:large conductance mechanosensitive channel protein MscL n=1 Tax=Homoserinibacter sp. YIM 151385 TaxID=2985506 RepID=UPI0022F0A318|nr:large conductance mechanosensitive channel protein MscL [Homoserinibacter sp. YIM 151385]WBU37907.1 large conductance mechanosensitive channel protein MscL [Homoserinibacter sp. YIM 151385]